MNSLLNEAYMVKNYDQISQKLYDILGHIQIDQQQANEKIFLLQCEIKQKNQLINELEQKLKKSNAQDIDKNRLCSKCGYNSVSKLNNNDIQLISTINNQNQIVLNSKPKYKRININNYFKQLLKQSRQFRQEFQLSYNAQSNKSKSCRNQIDDKNKTEEKINKTSYIVSKPSIFECSITKKDLLTDIQNTIQNIQQEHSFIDQLLQKSPLRSKQQSRIDFNFNLNKIDQFYQECNANKTAKQSKKCVTWKPNQLQSIDTSFQEKTLQNIKIVNSPKNKRNKRNDQNREFNLMETRQTQSNKGKKDIYFKRRHRAKFPQFTQIKSRTKPDNRHQRHDNYLNEINESPTFKHLTICL